MSEKRLTRTNLGLGAEIETSRSSLGDSIQEVFAEIYRQIAEYGDIRQQLTPGDPMIPVLEDEIDGLMDALEMVATAEAYHLGSYANPMRVSSSVDETGSPAEPSPLSPELQPNEQLSSSP